MSLDSSSDDESVSEHVAAQTEQQSTPTVTPTVVPTAPTCDADIADVSAAVTTDDDVSSPTDEQPVADIVSVYQNVTAPSVADEEPQQQQQQQQLDDTEQHPSDVDVLPASRPQCMYELVCCFHSSEIRHTGTV